MLVADDAVLIDDVGFGHAVNTEVDADVSNTVIGDTGIWVAMLFEPSQGVGAIIFVVNPENRNGMGDRKVNQL